MALVLEHTNGILLINYVSHKTTITGEYYTSLMERFWKVIKDIICRQTLVKGVLFLHNKMPVYKARVSQIVIHDCGFEQLASWMSVSLFLMEHLHVCCGVTVG